MSIPGKKDAERMTPLFRKRLRRADTNRARRMVSRSQPRKRKNTKQRKRRRTSSGRSLEMPLKQPPLRKSLHRQSPKLTRATRKLQPLLSSPMVKRFHQFRVIKARTLQTAAGRLLKNLLRPNPNPDMRRLRYPNSLQRENPLLQIHPPPPRPQKKTNSLLKNLQNQVQA